MAKPRTETQQSIPVELEPKQKKKKLSNESEDRGCGAGAEDYKALNLKSSTLWVKFGKRLSLDKTQREEVESGKRLTDMHISFAQELLKSQFQITGLQSTLLQHSHRTPCCSLQIIFCRSDHWIVASTIKSKEGTVNVYDSLFDELDDSTEKTVQFLFPNKTIQVVPVQKQCGYDDCGLVAIANAVQLARGHDPLKAHYSQYLMRTHLIKCYEELKMTPFPTV